MSPWPENQNEPKAPDKNSDSNNSTVESGARTKICNSAVTDSDIPDPLVPEESIASLNMINSTSDNESAQDVPKTPNPVQDVSNSPKPVQDVLNPPKPVQDIPDTSKPIQDVPNTSKPEQDSQNTSKPVQDIPDTSKHLQDAPNTSKHLQDVPNTSKHLKDAPDSSKHLQDTPSTSKHLQDAPNSSKHPQDTPSTSKHLQDAPNTSKNLQDAPNTSKHLQDAPNTSKNLQDAPNTSKNLQDAPNTSKHLQDAPNTSKHLQDAPNSSKHPQDTPSTSKHLQDAPNTSKNLQDAPNTSKNLQDAPNTSKHLQDAPSTSKHVQDVPSTSKNLQDVPKPEEDIQPLQSTSKPSERKPVIDDLDDDGLKSLLEEAITYKSPKDKDTKSALFQNLLIEAEKKDDSEQSDDDGSGSQFQPLGLGRTRYGYAPPRKRLNRRDTDRQRGGGSLQNLSCGPKLANRVSVSARQREGGSLPTNVNQSCAADDNLYTSRATLQVSSPLESIPTPKPNPPAVMNGVEHAPLQLHSTYNSVKSVVGSETALKSGPSSEGTVQHVSTCFLPISPQQSVTLLRDTDLRQFATYTKDPTETKIKSFDENGNALATSNRVEAGTSERKAKRKKKNYRNIINAENIEGHRWDEDIDSLMKYINSGSNEEEKSHKSRQSASSGARATVHSKIKAQDECRKKRGAKELRKIQKSNSMEEISKTKLEDLTSPSEKSPEENNTRVKPKKQVTLDDNQLEASCWQTEEASTLSVSVEKLVIDTEDKKKVFEKKESFSDLQDADFHLVKKKQRKKKRPANNARPGCSKASNYGYHPNQGFPSHYRRSTTTVQQERVQPRRKSASSVPPSDKSDSSDLDSVHSLPVSSTTPKPTVGKTSTSGGSTPLASYADIARSMAAPPTPPPPPPAPPTPPPPPPVLPAAPSQPLRKDAMTDTDSDKMLLPVEEYPPLARKVECSDYFVEVTFKRGGRTEETIIVKPSVPSKNSSDVRVESEVKKEQSTSQKQAATDAAGASRRPPVILLNRSGRSSPKHPLDVTFGFDINQELLAESEPVTRQPYDHASTVNYIKAEWDEVMRLFNSNARSDRAESKQPQVQYYKP